MQLGNGKGILKDASHIAPLRHSEHQGEIPNEREKYHAQNL